METQPVNRGGMRSVTVYNIEEPPHSLKALQALRQWLGVPRDFDF